MKSMTRAVRLALIGTSAALILACGGAGTPTQRLKGNLSLLAGHAAGPGNSDASGAAAGFFSPNGVASDSAGNVYVADSGNHTIRKIAPDGAVSTIAGASGQSGAADGSGTAARLNNPAGIAIDAAGNLFVADSGNSTIRKITPAGVVSTLAGSPQVRGSADGVGAAASFDTPWAIATDSAGNVYVADSTANTIRKVTPAAVVTTLASGLNFPSGVATDSDGNVYVADTENHVIRRITPAGAVSIFAGTLGVQGASDGPVTGASFTGPAGIAVVGNGANPIVYVADTGNSTIRKIAAGAVTTLAGTAQSFGSADATGPAASFLFPHGLGVDGAGQVYAADTGNHTIRKITSAGVVSTLAGTAAVQGSADAPASFFGPSGVAVDGAGTAYVADKGNRSVRSVTANGTVSTLALTGGGFDPQARPEAIALDRLGNIYVSDRGGAIFKVTQAGEISTLAGALGQLGSADGPGATATFNTPAGIAVDPSGNVFVADSGNATIRKITTSVDGVVTVSTFAGTAGTMGSSDGAGGNASFAQPWGIATDDAGNVYVADPGNNNVRKISAAGNVITLAGHSLEAGSADGVGAQATFNKPLGIALDGANNVYVADTNNHTLRAITPAGVVSTIGGTRGRRGFRAGPVPGTLADPVAIGIGGSTIYLLINNGVVTAQ